MPPTDPQLTTTQTSPTGVLSFDSIPGHVEHYPDSGGRGVAPKTTEPVAGPSISKPAPTTGEDVLHNVAQIPVDPMGEAGKAWDSIKEELRNHQGEHPLLGSTADKMDALQELLFGGQSAGKPMGTRGGVADEANALTAAADAPELAEGAVNLASKGLEGLAETGRTFAEGMKDEASQWANAKAPRKKLDFSSIDGHQLLQEGKDFAGNFEKDNFASRRTTGNNMFDPESLVTGEEIERGFTPKNSRRVYPSHEAYLDVVHGNVPTDQVASRFPRQFVESPEKSSEAGFLQIGGKEEKVPVQEMEKPEEVPFEVPETEATAERQPGDEEKSTLDRMKEVYPTTTDPGAAQRGASFITPEGEFMPLGAGTEHPQAIEKVTGKASDEGPGFDNRPEFLNDTGLVRVRMTQDRAGTTAHVSVPSKGVNPQQITAIQQLVGKNRYGNLMLEVAEKGGASEYKEYASPADVEPMVKNIGAHPQEWSRVAAKNMDENGGFTIQPRTGQVPTEGYAVEVRPEGRRPFSEDKPVTHEDIKDFYQAHKTLFDEHPELHIGGWKGELNITGVAKDRAGAELLAKQLDQKAIYDIKNGQEIPIGGANTKTSFPRYSLEDRLANLSGKNVSKLPPTIKNSPHLTDQEKYLLGSDPTVLKDFRATRKKIASVQELAETAKAGEANRFWYDRARASFDTMFNTLPKGSFPPEDREKFIGLVAATSPRSDVTENLASALNAYRAWVAEGRPTDPYQVRSAIDSSLMMPASHGPNATRALTGQPLSGPKVTSFQKNFMGSAQHVTNDMWGALTNGIVDAKDISESHAGSYIALSENYRRAAESLGWTPQQAQAASWGFVRTLGNMAGFGGKQAGKEREAQSVVNMIDDPTVRKYSADIADIFLTSAKVRGRLEDLGIDLEEFDGKLRTAIEPYGRGTESGKTRGTNPKLLARTAEKVEQGKQFVRAQARAGKNINEKAMPLLQGAMKGSK